MTKTEILLNGIDVSIEELTSIATRHNCSIDVGNYPIVVSYTGLADMTPVYEELIVIKDREGVQTKDIFNVARQQNQSTQTLISVGYSE